ncbi:MAG: replication factor C large subunit [Thermoproteota archaeon]|nr:replication factor C large subunit [Thermoproteota archaeon]
MYAAWTLKHKPKSLSEVVGNKKAIGKFKEWLKSWEKGIPKKRAAFLHGPPGVGKTVTAEALANDWGMELVEKNASDYRTKSAVEKFAGLASQYSTLFGKKRFVLFDELDGIAGTQDRGGVGAIIKVVKEARCPVVLIANHVYDPRFRSLRKYCFLVKFKRPTARQVIIHLKRICGREGIQAEENALKFIAQRSEGDVRSAVNDLQALAQGKKRLTYDDVSWLAYRNRKDVIFKVLQMILYGRTCESAKRAVEMADMDLDMLFEWIYENAPRHLSDPHDLANAMDALALADVYRGRIRTTLNWKLMRYQIDFMSAGVAMAREHGKPGGWIPFQFPGRIRSLGRTKRERALQSAIGMKVRKKCHISARRSVREMLPYLKIIFENNAKMAAGLMKWLDLDEKMVEYLAGNKRRAKSIMKG